MRSSLALPALLVGVACTDPALSPSGSRVDLPDPSFIINGTPTGSSFGAVGALMYDFDGNGTITGVEQLCTGSLISATVFLTAGHCVSFLPASAQFYVTFDPTLLPNPSPLIAATAFHLHPAFGHDKAHFNDLAVVILPAGSTAGITPYSLPPAGHLDALAAGGGLVGASFLNVGYGIALNAKGRPAGTYDGVRKVSSSEFMALQPTWLGLLMNSNATGLGGDCYGDSGGPKFLQSAPTMVVATVTWGDQPCRATSWDWRLDTPQARAFLGQYVTLP